jgi:RNA polymerase sigma-70 factor (ECF subfamily)
MVESATAMSERRLSALTSLALLRQAQRGERDALDELFARYVPFLRRLAHGKVPAWARSTSETADLVQDTLLNVFRRIDRFEPRGNGAMRAYLRQTLQNRILNAKRDATRRPASIPLDDHDPPHDDPTPLERFLSAEDHARYLAALAAQRPEDRAAIVGRVQLGYTYEQLAAALDKPSADAARVAVRRAIARLSAEMQAADGSQQDGA